MEEANPLIDPVPTSNIEVGHQPVVIELSSSSSESQSGEQVEGSQSDIKIIDKLQNTSNKKNMKHQSIDLEEDTPKEKKTRKISPRCYICRKVGIRLESRQCTECKLWYHLECLNTKETKQSARFLCTNCDPLNKKQGGDLVGKTKKSAYQTRKLQKQKNKDIQLTLQFPGRGNDEEKKDKRKQFNTNVLNIFKERYPYYINQNRIDFPIEDKLLVIYKELFEVEKQLPQPDEPDFIPAKYFGDMLAIENFCMSFEDDIQFTFCPTKEIIYESFTKHPSDLCFKSLLLALINIYLGDIFDRNKTENVKALNQNPFFEILRFLKQNIESEQFLPQIWKQIVQKLQKVPSMAQAFDGLNKSVNIKTLQGKIHLIKELIMGLSQIDTFHDMMYKKTDKKQDLTKERNELIIDLKRDEADILTQSHVYKETEIKIKEIQHQHQQLSESGTAKKDEINKSWRELEKMKKSQVKADAVIEKLKENVSRIKLRIGEINKSIPFITGEIQFLGRDRNDSEYFLYSRQPNKVYVSCKPTYLNTAPAFKVFKNREKITHFIKHLNNKGIKEKQLFNMIQSHLKCGVINDTEYVYSEQQRSNEPDTFEQETIQLTSQDIVNILFECDDNFTNYLLNRNYRWINPAKREIWKQEITKKSSNMLVLRENLEFMHEQFLYVENLGNTEEQSDEARSERAANSDGDSEQEVKKKRIRLWGIYFEKIKKYWVEYLKSATTLQSVWTAAIMFKHFVDRYIRKKMQGVEEREKKLEKEQQREREKDKKERHQRLERQKQQRNLQNQNHHNQSQSHDSDSSNPNRRRLRPLRRQPPKPRGRLVRKSQRNLRHVNLKQVSSQSQQYQASEQQSGSNQSHEDACYICGEFGEMLCCDTCPKVFHIECLKLKQVPDDEWSCVPCLEKIANERQTRSRTRRML